MPTTALILVGVLLALPASAAQSRVPSSKLHPVTVASKKVTIDYVTGKRIPPGNHVLAANVQTIYNNTCTWATQGYYAGFESCEDLYDEGRIPSLAPGSGSPVSWDGFTFSYCTFNASSFQCNIAFADNAGGQCAGLVPQTPPPWTTSSVYTEINLSALGLPGSTSTGFQACWIVGITNLGLCVQADGDGTFDGNPATDLFTWAFNHKMPSQFVAPEGLIISGDPNVAAGGSCTYNIPCGTDPFTGGPCGSGLGSEDSHWENLDNTPVGSTVPTFCPNAAGNGFGTNCYFFGGWPGNPFTSYYFTMEGGRTCASCVAGLAYCRNNPSFDGCIASMTDSGLPQISNPNGHSVTVINAPGQQNSIQFVGLNGPNFAPFANGFLCVAPPLIRLTIKNTGGAVACDGSTTSTLAEVQTACANFGTPISAGSTVHQQTWIRDPQSTATTAVSNGITYTVCP